MGTTEYEDGVDQEANGDMRCGAHTDFGGLTLLFQCPSQPGLEVQMPDSTWLPVAVNPPGTEDDPLPPIVVNIGDLLSHWTGGLLKSVNHRVVIPTIRKDDRYSIAYFCHPVATTKLVPVPSDLIKKAQSGHDKQGNEVPNTVLTAAQHLKRRLAEAYGWEQ